MAHLVDRAFAAAWPWRKSKTKWRNSIQGRVFLYWLDFWHDFFATLKEVSRHITLAQICASACMLFLVSFIHLLVWGAFSALITGPILYLAWNYALEPHCFWIVSPLTYNHAVAISLAMNILLFRSIRFEVKARTGKDGGWDD